MTFQGAKSVIEECAAYSKSKRSKAEAVLLAEIDALRRALGSFISEIDEYNLVAYDDGGLSPDQIDMIKSARAVFDRTKL